MRHLAHPVKHLPYYFFIADDKAGLDSLKIARRLPPGCGIIFRYYDARNREDLASCFAQIAHERRLILLIAGSAALAHAVGAHGIHLPQWQLYGKRPRKRPGWIITAAAHDRAALYRARAWQLDAVLVSPCFPTQSHPDAAALGSHRLSRLIKTCHLNAYALGGVKLQTIKRLPPYLNGIAAISAFSDRRFMRQVNLDQKLKRVPR